jgi:hypothetical protein
MDKERVVQIRPEGMGVDGRVSGFVLRRRPIFGLWLKFLNAAVCMLTLGKVRVVSVHGVINFRNWDGIIR